MNQSLSTVLKRRALELIRETKPSPLLVSLFLFAINSIVSLLTMYLSGYYDVAQTIMDLIFAGKEITSAEIFELTARHTSTGGTILVFALSLCVSVISVGFTWYCYRVVRGEKPEAKSIFDGFGSFFKIIRLQIATGFLVAVQLVLFIVPGIIASIRYSQAVYVMYEHPEYGVLQCIRESGRMMRGYKWEYFMLLLSFIGWVLVGALISTFIPLAVLDIWINIYMGLATALFHVHLMRAGLSGEEHRDSSVI